MLNKTETISLEYLPLGYIVTNLDHKILLINGSAKSILKETNLISTLEQVVEKLPERLQLLDHVKYCSVEHKSCSFREVEIGDRLVRLYLSPIFEGGNLTGNLITLEDITDKVNKEKAREQFLSFLVHEFRTPLTAIGGNAEMIKDFFVTDDNKDKLPAMANDIQTGSKYLLQMVNQFLDLSKLEEGTIKYDFKEFEIIALIDETIQSLDVIAKNKNIELKFHIEGPKKYNVVADPHRTKQVLTNLIGNAIKFTDRGEVNVSLTTDEEFLEISVNDTGHGIPLDSRENMFQKYFQASNNKMKNDSTKSTGIGLYVTRLIVEGMGGKVWLKSSELDKGSTFAFTVTLATEERMKRLQKQLNEAIQGAEHAFVSEHNTLSV